MSNFTINFELPWLLLLFIPALLFTLIPHLRLIKRYRRTRNRIVSIVLHLLIMTMGISLISVMTFAYDVPNRENEVILLVDESYSNRNSVDSRNEFIGSLIDASGTRFKMGILRFAYDTDYIEMTNDTDALYSSYIRAVNSNPLDGKGTDIEGALDEARSYLENPSTAKIVILTDGIQTDGNALSAVKALAAEGVKVDIVHFPNELVGEEVQLLSVDISEFTMNTDGNFILHVQSNVAGSAKVTMYDKDETGAETPYEYNVVLMEGIQEIPITHNFTFPNLHVLRFVIELMDGSSVVTDAIKENNELYSFVYLYEFKNILMVESIEGEGDALYELLKNGVGFGYNVEKVNINNNPEKLPTTLSELRKYDQVILSNISNADLETTVGISHDFDKLLTQYANIGGGVLAVGGSTYETINSEEPIPHAFNEYDMNNSNFDSYYRNLLPVSAEEYRPALGLMILIDKSTSMGWGISSQNSYPTRIEYARRGAIACLDALTYRDWVGVMTFEQGQTVDAELVPYYERKKVEAVLTNIVTEGGTMFGPAIEKAGQLLAACDSVERKHIIIVTDGDPNDYTMPGSSDAKRLETAIKDNLEMRGITLSVVGIGDEVLVGSTTANNMEYLCELGHGNFHPPSGNPEDIISEMRDELYQESITKTQFERFQPTLVKTDSPIVQGVTQAQIPQLNIFFGTMAKSSATTTFTVSKLNTVPIYSQWNYGNGKVGAFMSSLRGEWSGEFLNDPYGQRIILNMVRALMPTFDIRAYDIKAQLHEENFSTRLSIVSSTGIQDDDLVEVEVTNPNGTTSQTIEITQQPDIATRFSRAAFKVTEEGVYKIQVKKTLADNTVVYSAPIYKAFSYSSEYNAFEDQEASLAFLEMLADSGNGAMIDISNASSVLDNISTSIHRTYDPKLLFLILSIILFLLDIAVRKFKFKWPHELVRDYREKKFK